MTLQGPSEALIRNLCGPHQVLQRILSGLSKKLPVVILMAQCVSIIEISAEISDYFGARTKTRGLSLVFNRGSLVPSVYFDLLDLLSRDYTRRLPTRHSAYSSRRFGYGIHSIKS